MTTPTEPWDQSRFDGGLAAQQIDSIVPMPNVGALRAEILTGTDSPASSANQGDAGGLGAVQRGSSVEMPNPSQQHLGGANR